MTIPILLGDKETILELKREIEFNSNVEIIDPKTEEQKERRERFANVYWETRQRKGITLYEAQKLMRERNYFAAMLVNEGEADAMLTGYSRSYPSVVKPILELIPRAQGVSKVATTNLMMTKRGPMFLADTAINPNPSAEELAKIAYMTEKTVRMFGMEPVIAMLSYSNFGSGTNDSPKKMREAVRILHEQYPEMIVDGEIQIDFALNDQMLKKKFPFSKLVNKKVNTLIFPNLDAANITYKMLKELNRATSIGPMILGLDKAVHVFQLGASVDEMVNMTAVAVVDAQVRENRKKNK
jgi:malate dehydrogenase (oxaloacetate-decarboxylating)(NADP+)